MIGMNEIGEGMPRNLFMAYQDRGTRIRKSTVMTLTREECMNASLYAFNEIPPVRGNSDKMNKATMMPMNDLEDATLMSQTGVTIFSRPLKRPLK